MGTPGTGGCGATEVQSPQQQLGVFGFFFYSSSGNFGATCRELMPFSVFLKYIPSLGLQPSQIMDPAEKLLLGNSVMRLGRVKGH